VAILPGSRPNEVDRILPDLAAAAVLIRGAVPDAQFVVARAPHLDDRLFAPLRAVGVQPLAIVEGDTDAVLASADVALTASGTAPRAPPLPGRPPRDASREPHALLLDRRVLRGLRGRPLRDHDGPRRSG